MFTVFSSLFYIHNIFLLKLKKNECVTFQNKTNDSMKIGKVETCPSLTLELTFDAAFGTLKHCRESSLR